MFNVLYDNNVQNPTKNYKVHMRFSLFFPLLSMSTSLYFQSIFAPKNP